MEVSVHFFALSCPFPILTVRGQMANSIGPFRNNFFLLALCLNFLTFLVDFRVISPKSYIIVLTLFEKKPPKWFQL